jgi:hypothetical protein
MYYIKMSRERFILSNLLNLLVSIAIILTINSYFVYISIIKTNISILIIFIVILTIGYSKKIQNNIITKIGYIIWMKNI